MKITCWPPQDSLRFPLPRPSGHKLRRCFRLLRQPGVGRSPLEQSAKDRCVHWAADDSYDIARFVQSGDSFIGLTFIGPTMVRQIEPLARDLLTLTCKVGHRELDPYQVSRAYQLFHLSARFVLVQPFQSLHTEDRGDTPANQVLQGIEPGR